MGQNVSTGVMWAARDADGKLFLYTAKPKKDAKGGKWLIKGDGRCVLVDDEPTSLFFDVSWENTEATAVELLVKPNAATGETPIARNDMSMEEIAKVTYRCDFRPRCGDCMHYTRIACRLNKQPVRADYGVCDAFCEKLRCDYSYVDTELLARNLK